MPRVTAPSIATWRAICSLPMYVIEDTTTYPRAVDADGVAHHNAISYDYDAVIRWRARRSAPLWSISARWTRGRAPILMVQVENEIAVFGSDRRNRKMWRDHSPASKARYTRGALGRPGLTDDLKYSAWRPQLRLDRTLTDVGARPTHPPVPQFRGRDAGRLAWWAARRVRTWPRIWRIARNLSFIGLNLYASRKTHRRRLSRLPRPTTAWAATSRRSPRPTATAAPIAPRLAYLAVGEFGAPLYAPWADDLPPTPPRPGAVRAAQWRHRQRRPGAARLLHLLCAWPCR